jgi:flavin-binding protein dodecin
MGTRGPELEDNLIWPCEFLKRPDGYGQLKTKNRVLKGRFKMEDKVYRVIDVIGTSAESWEKAAQNAIEMASKSVRDLRVAEVIQMDLHLEDGKILAYRTKVRLSFKYHPGIAD